MQQEATDKQMRTFTDEQGIEWIADASEEQTPRHHGRWFLTLRSQSGDFEYELPEVRWQTVESARRILTTMAAFELRRRLKGVRARHASKDGASSFEGVGAGVSRNLPNANAG